MEKQEYERLRATRETVKNGTATFTQRNYMKMYEKHRAKKQAEEKAKAQTQPVRSTKKFGAND